MNEFELIERFFRRPANTRREVVVGSGDDAAVVSVAPGRQLVAAVDTLVEGVHFPKSHAPADVGHRSLAVNLSDLAAMAAEPKWALMALTLPAADEAWLSAFARAFNALADAHGVALIGGDITRGPLTVSITLFGEVDAGKALTRTGARAGDRIYVTGTLGDGCLGLQAEMRGDCGPAADWLRARFARPEPRVAAGLAVVDTAHAMIDVSDGFLADLDHVLTQSGVGARVDCARLPLSEHAVSYAGRAAALEAAATGGDDYELIFTADAAQASDIRRRLAASGCPVSVVGEITALPGLAVVDAGAAASSRPRTGFRHF